VGAPHRTIGFEFWELKQQQIIVGFIVLIISYVVQTVLDSLKGIGPGNVSVYNRSSVTDDN
jgi:hypothetical protein